MTTTPQPSRSLSWLRPVLIFVIILLFSGAFVQNRFLRVPEIVPNAIGIGLTAVLALSRVRSLRLLFNTGTFMRLLLLLALFSMLWSVIPEISFRRAVILAAAMLLGYIIAADYSLKEQVYFYSRVLLFVLFASIVLALFFPQNGIHQDPFQRGRWRGILLHKNVLGEYMSLASLLFLFIPANLLRLPRRLKHGYAGLCTLLMLLTGSFTSIGAWVLVLFCYPMLLALRRDYRLRLAIMCLFLAVLPLLLVLFVSNIDAILAYIGRDRTISGRSTIWPVVVTLIEARPVLGYGYMSFFVPDFYLVEATFREIWQPEHAHNVWLDLAIDFGLTGVVLFIGIIIQSLHHIYVLYVRYFRTEVLVVLLLLMSMLARSMTETLAIQRRDLIWIMFVSLTVRLIVEYRLRRHSHHQGVQI